MMDARGGMGSTFGDVVTFAHLKAKYKPSVALLPAMAYFLLYFFTNYRSNLSKYWPCKTFPELQTCFARLVSRQEYSSYSLSMPLNFIL